MNKSIKQYIVIMLIYSLYIHSFKSFLPRVNNIARPFNNRLQRLSSDLTIGSQIVVLTTGEVATIVKKLKTCWKCVIKTDDEEKIVKLKDTEFKAFNSVMIDKENLQINEEILHYDLPTINPSKKHKETNKWIIFSDLHVKGSSIEICEQVLYQVNEEAKKRDAGILFLGDFWHVRGALSVELLNRVLKSLRSWTQPVIMIPGNHDQVSLGGSIHALEPLIYAFPRDQAVLISEPSILLNALWIPYRRDPNVMKGILRACKENSDISIIFCHADVKGAFMNDGMKCKEGIDVSEFPTNIPIYSGHFHKPHTMKQGDSKLRYVGSPYQTSLSEAGQAKYLYLMSYTKVNNICQWYEEDRWEINIGKKFIKATSLDDPIISTANPGDRLVVPIAMNEYIKADELLKQYRLKGIEIELRYEKTSIRSVNKSIGSDIVNDTIDNSYSLDLIEPLTIYDNYIQSSNITSIIYNNNDNLVDSNKNQLFNEIITEGRNVLQSLLSSSLSSKELSSTGKFRELRFESVKLTNFGSYGGEPVLYPLSNRGLVLIRGKSSDGTGADSNGSGKTTLAMSVMWALTGSMDTRIVSDGKAVDVTYDTGNKSTNRTAEVTIKGYINNLPFTLTRKRGKKAELIFTLDGKDLTKQAVKDTQVEIDETLGIGNGLLQRCCFFGQHSHTMQSLLGLTDKDLKNELNALVNTDIWNNVQKEIRDKYNKNKQRCNNINIEYDIRNNDVNKTNHLLNQSITNYNNISEQLDSINKKYSNELGSYTTNITNLFIQLDTIKKSIDETRQTIEPLNHEIINLLKEKTNLTNELNKYMNQINEQIFQCKGLLSNYQSNSNTINNKLKSLSNSSNDIISNINAAIASYLNNNSDDKAFIIKKKASNFNDIKDILSVINIDEIKSNYNELTSNNIIVNSQISRYTNILTNIQKINDNITSTSCQHIEDDICSNCGQAIQLSKQIEKYNEIKEKIVSYNNELVSNNKDISYYTSQINLFTFITTNYNQLILYNNQINELATELNNITNQSMITNNKFNQLTDELNKNTNRLNEIENNYIITEKSKSLQLKQLQTQVNDLINKEKKLVIDINNARQEESKVLNIRSEMNAMKSKYEERLRTANDTVLSYKDSLKSQQVLLDTLTKERNALLHSSIINEKLIEIFGPRCIQHYIYTNVINQIENIANTYLMVLADSGIQISLQSDKDADRIIKIIRIRSVTDGKFRERALSQLSGGQWRRVSLALDLAFTEIVRRRGLLRSNLMVMDEILTHLDASGREAVGSLLRAMSSTGSNKKDSSNQSITNSIEYLETDNVDSVNVSPSKLSDEISNSLVGGGHYETVIVILQDLVAMELEEAFDHIDVVVKDADISTVTIDQ